MDAAGTTSSPFAVMASLDSQQRMHRLESEDLPDLLIEQWWGHESLIDGFDYWMDVLHVDANLPFGTWLGKSASLLTQLTDGTYHVRSGFIAEASRLGSDGGLACFRLRLVPWTWLLAQARSSHVFQEQSVAEIVDSVFKRHATLARWRWSEDAVEALQHRTARSYCVQYRESDLAFVQRLLAEEGIGWRYEEADNATAAHVLILFSDSHRQPQDKCSSAWRGVRFHRHAGVEQRDAIQTLGKHHRLGSTQLTLTSSDYRSTQVRQVQLKMHGGGHGEREDYDHAGAYAYTNTHEGQRHAQRAAEAAESHHAGWHGRGTVRSLQAGRWISVEGWSNLGPSPELWITQTLHHGSNPAPTALDTRDALLRNPPPDSWLTAALKLNVSTLAASAEVGYANAFLAQDRQRPWRPVLHDGTGQQLNPRPLAPGYQSAIVVAGDGRDDHDLHADSLGRIRVRFHFQDDADGNATCWLRVAQRYAGPGVGMQFLPRVGQEVLIGFLEGDIDRPIVMGALYNGRGQCGVSPTPAGAHAAEQPLDYALARDQAPSAQGNLVGGNAPAWHAMAAGQDHHRHPGALWGIQSREWSGQGFNRLLFDDTDNQLRLQLSSSQAHTQLNLGHLIHQADNFRGSLRGQGLELRTDAWGAFRAERGSWLSAREHSATAPAGELAAAGALLEQATLLTKRSHEIASIHLTVGLASHGQTDDPASVAALRQATRATVDGGDYLHAQRTEGKTPPVSGHIPHTHTATLGLYGQAGVAMVAGQALHWAAGQHLVMAAGGNSDTTVMGQARLHAVQAIGILASTNSGKNDSVALSAVAGTGALEVMAQSAQVSLQARQSLQVTSAQGALEMVAPKALHIATAGGASILLEGGNITINCPGTITVHAGSKSFVGPAQLSYPLPAMPSSEITTDISPLAFRLQDIPGPQGIPLAGQAWKIVRTNEALESDDHDLAIAPANWATTLAEGVADEEGNVLLEPALSREIWQEVGRYPSRLFLIHGMEAIPLQHPRPYSSSPGMRATMETIDAINYGKSLTDLPTPAALQAYLQRAEYEFQSHLDAAPAERKEI